MASQFFNSFHREPVGRRGDGERTSRQAGSSGAADAVHVVFGMMRHVEVEHVRQSADVEAARGHIAAHQQPQFVGLEFLQRGEAHRLRHVAVQRAHVEFVRAQRLEQDVDVDLAVAEDQGVLHVLGPDQVAQCLPLVVLSDQGKPLGDGGRDRGRAGNRYFLRVLQEGVRQPLDLRPHGGGEKQRLPGLGQHRDNAFNVRDEAHVQHAVGFVDHQQFGIRQQDGAALEHVDQAAGRGDQYVHAFVQSLFLVRHAFAADDQSVRQLQVFAVHDKIFGDLQRQLARRLQNQAARHTSPRSGTREDIEHRQREPSGLASASLRGAHHVAAHQDVGDRLFLDWRRVAVAHIGDGLQHSFR